jgi:hypothetical protein
MHMSFGDVQLACVLPPFALQIARSHVAGLA